MILVVDHYDSFTYNLVQLIESLGRSTVVVKSDAKPASELVAMKPDAVVLSPGPGHPREAEGFTELLGLLPGSTPVLGVCLGHQAIGLEAGGISYGDDGFFVLRRRPTRVIRRAANRCKGAGSRCLAIGPGTVCLSAAARESFFGRDSFNIRIGRVDGFTAN